MKEHKCTRLHTNYQAASMGEYGSLGILTILAIIDNMEQIEFVVELIGLWPIMNGCLTGTYMY